MNSFHLSSFRKQKKGFIFLIDIFFSLILLVTFMMTLVTYSAQAPDDDVSQFSFTQSVYATLDNSGIVTDAIDASSTVELIAFFDESIPLPFCAQSLVYTTADSLTLNATQTDCTFSTDNLQSAYGTVVSDDVTYIVEVFVWIQ